MWRFDVRVYERYCWVLAALGVSQAWTTLGPARSYYQFLRNKGNRDTKSLDLFHVISYIVPVACLVCRPVRRGSWAAVSRLLAEETSSSSCGCGDHGPRDPSYSPLRRQLGSTALGISQVACRCAGSWLYGAWDLYDALLPTRSAWDVLCRRGGAVRALDWAWDPGIAQAVCQVTLESSLAPLSDSLSLPPASVVHVSRVNPSTRCVPSSLLRLQLTFRVCSSFFFSCQYPHGTKRHLDFWSSLSHLCSGYVFLKSTDLLSSVPFI